MQITAIGGPEQLRMAEVAVGDPGPGEVRIRHHASGLNFIDVYHRTGLYPLPLPATLGVEGAGVIEAVGEGVTHLHAGDRAAYVSGPPQYATRSPAFTQSTLEPTASTTPAPSEPRPDGIASL